MVTVALYVKLEAKPGKEAEVESFLKGALPVVQEEPKNMGAWSFVKERSPDFRAAGQALTYGGRAASPSPATGNAAVHKRELEQFLAEAFA
jgi:2-oxoglutarate dehydrogenase complex dehydrogenase (E1) component-like enzyme